MAKIHYLSVLRMEGNNYIGIKMCDNNKINIGLKLKEGLKKNNLSGERKKVTCKNCQKIIKSKKWS